MSTAQTIHCYRVSYVKKNALAQNDHYAKQESLRIKARDEHEAKNNAAHSLGDAYTIIAAERIDGRKYF